MVDGVELDKDEERFGEYLLFICERTVCLILFGVMLGYSS